MTAKFEWFVETTKVSLRKMALTKPGQTSAVLTSILKNTGDEALGSITISLSQQGSSVAYQWISGTVQRFDEEGVDVGDPEPFDVDTPATFAGPFPPDSGLRCVYTAVVPIDAPLNGVGAPWGLTAQEG